MKTESTRRAALFVILSALAVGAPLALATVDDTQTPAKAYLDGTGPGFRDLTEGDFVPVNCDPETWTWKDGVIHCTGRPVGVIRTKKPVTNFELVARVAAPPVGRQFGDLRLGAREGARGHQARPVPRGGIEVQVLDHGYTEQYEKQPGKKPTWFTTNGDVFPVGTSKMTPFPPVSPDGSRSFPTKHLSKGVGAVEPLLRPGHQRRGPALGQRRGGLRRQQLRATVGISLPRIGRFAGRVPAAAHPRAALKWSG